MHTAGAYSVLTETLTKYSSTYSAVFFKVFKTSFAQSVYI